MKLLDGATVLNFAPTATLHALRPSARCSAFLLAPCCLLLSCAELINCDYSLGSVLLVVHELFQTLLCEISET